MDSDVIQQIKLNKRSTMDNFFAKKGISLSGKSGASHYKDQLLKASHQTATYNTQTNTSLLTTPNWPTSQTPSHSRAQSQHQINPSHSQTHIPYPTSCSDIDTTSTAPTQQPKIKATAWFQDQTAPPIQPYFQNSFRKDQFTLNYDHNPIEGRSVPLADRNAQNEVFSRKRDETSMQLSPSRKTVEREPSSKKIAISHQNLSEIKNNTHHENPQDENKPLSVVSVKESPQFKWREEKMSLYRELNEKSDRIRELETKLNEVEKVYKEKETELEYKLRRMEGTKNRLHYQNESNLKKVESERLKNQESREKMHKLIFFEDDLIHAKDYDKVKEELEDTLLENAKMYKDHQQFILEVKELRRKSDHKIEDLEDEIKGLRNVLEGYQARFEAIGLDGSDKMRLIKLQNQLNFMKKKNNEQLTLIMEKGSELEEAKNEVQRLSLVLKDGKNTQYNGMDIEEVNTSIASYCKRLDEMNGLLEEKTEALRLANKKVEFLSSELSKNREDRSISTRREKNAENSLKNEVETLQRSLQGQKAMSERKISTLEDSLRRKKKEIDQKDKFIKDFLLGRSKQLEDNGMDQIMSSLVDYFEGDNPE